jgi:hypothetical protein
MLTQHTLQFLMPPLFSSVPTILVVADSNVSVADPPPLLLLLPAVLLLLASTPPLRDIAAAAWMSAVLIAAIAAKSSICVYAGEEKGDSVTGHAQAKTHPHDIC